MVAGPKGPSEDKYYPVARKRPWKEKNCQRKHILDKTGLNVKAVFHFYEASWMTLFFWGDRILGTVWVVGNAEPANNTIRVVQSVNCDRPRIYPERA